LIIQLADQAVIWEIWGFHGGEDSSRGLLGCDAVWCWGRIPSFSPLYAEDGG